jgi:hypothetical protein
LDGQLGNKDLSFVGHSLGGGLASANSLATGRQGFTFNAAGLSPGSRTLYGLNRKANIQAYVVDGEAVSVSQKLLGLRAEGKITILPAVYLPYIMFAPPQVRTATTVINGGLSIYNHTMGPVMKKMEEKGIE